MFSAFEWLVAMRYLRARRREGFISVIAWFSLVGIALGVATLIIVMSVFNGLHEELMTRILGLNGHVSVQGPVDGIRAHVDWMTRVRAVPGVVAVYPVVERQVMVTAGGASRPAIVRGLPTDDLADGVLPGTKIVDGSVAELGDDDSVAIGARMAQYLGLRVGDQVTLIAPSDDAAAFGSAPRARAFRIAAIFEIGMHEYDSGFVFMSLPAAQSYVQLPDAVTSLEVFVDNPERAPSLAVAIAAAVPEAIRVLDWQRVNAGFFTAVKVERIVTFIILTLIILVASFNIVSSLIMLVNDKGRGIAILRTMGATRGSVTRIFFLAGASVGVFGTIIGFVLGVALAGNVERIRAWLQGLSDTGAFDAEIRFLSQLPAKVDPWEVAIVFVVALALTFAATIYPSWRAARVDPTEALRYE